MTRSFRTVGALYHPSSTQFTAWAPEKAKVELLLSTHSQPIAMEKSFDGYWSVTVRDVHPGDIYQFRIDADKLLPDLASCHQPQGALGPSAIFDQRFPWTDENWPGHSPAESVIYEIHVGTFTFEGTFAGVASKLEYLRDLGITTIEIMPVNQFSGARNWGYDGVFPFAVQNSYGGPMELKKLVNDAHRLGIAVILDVVYNHIGPEGNYFSEYGPYFSDAYKSNWGKAINFDGAWCDGVRNFFFQNALMWLQEFHIDGLRLDAVHAIYDHSAHHFVEELQAKVSELSLTSGKKYILIAEIDLNDPRYINPQEAGGYGLAAQWCDEFHHALHSIVTGEVNGYYEDFGEYSDLVKAMQDSYVYTGQYSRHRKKQFGRLPVNNPFDQFIVFAQNHDQIGNRMLGERLSTLVPFEQQKLCAAVVLLSPQIPLLFMGEEYGEKNPFQYFASHSDPNLVEAVREGRKKEFHYFHFDGEAPDPFADKTFNDCVLTWDLTSKQNAALHSFYKELISIRKSVPALGGRKREDLHVLESTPKGLIEIERTYENSKVGIAFNFSPNNVLLSEANVGRIIFSSTDERWDGSERKPVRNAFPNVAPFSATLYEIAR